MSVISGPHSEALATTASTAIFSLEDDLLHGETLLPFLQGYARWRGRRYLPLRLRWETVSQRFSRRDAHELLQRLLTLACAGDAIDDVHAYADWFAHIWIRNHMNFAAMGRLRSCQRAGGRAIVVSASPDLYAPYLAEHLGIETLHCTRTEQVDGLVTGHLAGPIMTIAAVMESLAAEPAATPAEAELLPAA